MKVLILCTALAISLSAQNHPAWKDKPFSGDPVEMIKAAQSFPPVDNADVQILFNQIDEKFDANGAASFRLWRIFRVLTAEGAKEWGTVSSSWQPWHEDRPVIRARAISPDGTVHQVDPATIAESAERDDEPNVLRDGKRVSAPIPGMAVGTLVEEEVFEHETRPSYQGGSMLRFSMDFDVPVQWSRLIAEAPSTLPLRYTLNKLPESAVSKTTEGGLTRLVVEQGPLAAVDEVLPLLPSSAARHHGISLSTGENWQRFAERYSAVVDAQIDGANLKSWTSNLRGSREEKIAALMARLHKEIRYTGIEFGEAAIVPHKPSEVLARKLGDCKDKASLLVALLRATGIPAHVALLSSGGGQDIDPALPGGGMFNHAIVYVPGTPDYWIDATDEFAKLGEMNDDNQGRWALIASPQTAGLKMIPEGDSTQNLAVEKREFFLPDFGGSRLIETTELSGAQASHFRQYYYSHDQKTVKEGLEEYAKNEYLTDSVDKWEAGDAHDLAHPYQLRIEMSKAKRGSVELQSAAIGIPAARLTDSMPKYFTTEPDAKKSKKDVVPRKEEFVVRYPYSKEWRYQISVPEGFRMRKTPDAGTTALGTASLTTEFGPLKDGVMSATLRFDSGKSHLTPDEAEATRKAVLELRKAPVLLIQLEQTGEALLTQGKVLEALAEFRALCAKHPDSAIDRDRLARADLAVGIGEAARIEAKKATELDPKSAKAWSTLGWVLMHDLIGRLRKPGFDYDGALAAYRKAKELDPKDDIIVADLAILLEFDALGERYASKARLAEAIEQYKQLGDRLAETGLADNLLFAYAYAGRFEELKKDAVAGQQTQSRRALTLIAIAHLENPEAAVQEAFRWTMGDDTRRGILQTASNILMRLRDYAASGQMLSAMAKNAPNAGTILNSANAIGKTRRFEDLKLDESDPISFSQKFIRTMSTIPLNAQAAMGFYAASTNRVISKEDAMGTTRILRKSFAKTGLPLATLLDLGLGSARISSDGDKETALRISALFAGQMRETYFLVPEKGRWKVAATHIAPWPLGALAREHALAGRLTVARQILDWARELTPGAEAEDAVQGRPFARLWERGKEAGIEEVLTAAAALSASDAKIGAWTIDQLQKARAAASDPAKWAPVDVALVEALGKQKRWEDVSAVTLELIQSFPRSAAAFQLRLGALTEYKKFAEIRELAQSRLKSFPDDPMSIRTLARVAEFESDFKTQRAELARLEKRGVMTSADLNGLLWDTLIDGTTNAETVELALRTSQMAPDSFPELHSVAAVMAQQGKTNEAQSFIVQAMGAAGMDEPEENCWLVLGKIAEQLGFKDVAKSRYARVEKPENAGPSAHLTSYALAQRWIREVR